MRQIQPENYDNLEPGNYVIEAYGFVKVDKGFRIESTYKTKAKLIRARSQTRFIKKDGKYTEDLETVGDAVVFIPEPNPDNCYLRVISCGLFKIYQD